MKKILLATAMLCALASGAKADIVRTLGGQNWKIADGGTLLTLGGVPAGQQVDQQSLHHLRGEPANQTNFRQGSATPTMAIPET